MTVTTQVLNGGQQLTASAAAIVTGGAAMKTVITKARFANLEAATAYTFTVYRVPSGGSPATSNIIINARSIAPSCTDLAPELNGMTLNAGDTIQALASTTLKINAFVSGFASTQ